jgi:Na+/alanine symporter
MTRWMPLFAALLWASPALAEDAPAPTPDAPGEAAPEADAAAVEPAEDLNLIQTCVTARPPMAVADGDPPPSAFDHADAWFGDCVVGPMAAVMFWDVAFWDNALKASADSVGVELDGQIVTAVSEDVFTVAPFQDVDSSELVAVLAADGGALSGRASARLEQDGALFSVVLDAQELVPGPEALVLAGEFQGTVPEAVPVAEGYARHVSTQLVRDVAVVVDVSTEEPGGEEPLPWTIPAQSSVAPEALIPAPAQGQAVLYDGATWQWASVNEEGAARLLGAEQTLTETPTNPKQLVLPVVVLWLVLGALFFTFRMGFINIRGFGHALAVTAGRYDEEHHEGEVSHFQALSSALSATVGLGNIAGVALAVAAGGPGAVFWMVVAGFLGMSSKFAECTLGQMYRVKDANGQLSGGPMRYLHAGLQELGVGKLGKVLAVIFALMCIGGSFGGGNMFQANQSYEAVAEVVPLFAPKAEGEVLVTLSADADAVELAEGAVFTTEDGIRFVATQTMTLKAGSNAVHVHAEESSPAGNVVAGAIVGMEAELAGVESVSNGSPTTGGAEPRAWLYGLILAVLVGLVIIGGIKSIGRVAGIIVPFMCGVYVLAAIWILAVNGSRIPEAFGTILEGAFTLKAGFGGLLGVLITGFRRAAFSNEAGVGSASIAHSAASTNEPVREGIVALLEPFIDTIVVCTMTGLVVVITGAYLGDAGDGVKMTSAAFASVIDWFPLVLSLAVVLFAFSTMISWSYYGERCWTYLFGEKTSMIYKVLFLAFVVLGSTISLGNVLDFSDLMILGMAFPNILGVALLSGKVKAKLDDYWRRYKSGEMEPAKADQA